MADPIGGRMTGRPTTLRRLWTPRLRSPGSRAHAWAPLCAGAATGATRQVLHRRRVGVCRQPRSLCARLPRPRPALPGRRRMLVPRRRDEQLLVEPALDVPGPAGTRRVLGDAVLRRLDPRSRGEPRRSLPARDGGVDEVLAQAVAIVLVTPVNFVGNKLWSFGPRRWLTSAASPFRSPSRRRSRVPGPLGAVPAQVLHRPGGRALAWTRPTPSGSRSPTRRSRRGSTAIRREARRPRRSSARRRGRGSSRRGPGRRGRSPRSSSRTRPDA